MKFYYFLFLSSLLLFSPYLGTVQTYNYNKISNSINLGSTYIYGVGGANISESWPMLDNLIPKTGWILLNVTKIYNSQYYGIFNSIELNTLKPISSSGTTNLTNFWVWNLKNESDWINYTLSHNNQTIGGFIYSDHFYIQQQQFVQTKLKNTFNETLIVNTSSNILLNYELKDPFHLETNFSKIDDLQINFVGEGYEFLTTSSSSKNLFYFSYQNFLISIIFVVFIKKVFKRKLY